MREPGQSELRAANLRQHERRLRNGSITYSLAGVKGDSMFTTARRKRQTRERLDACLAELNKIRPTALLREDVLGRDLGFRAGLAYFDRLLELFHRLSRCDLDVIPLARLEKITIDAENTVGQFRKILSFTGQDLDRPREARDLLIDEVRDSFERVSTNLAIVVSQLPEQHQEVAPPTGAALMLGICVLVSALAVLAYYSMNNRTVAENLLNAVHKIRARFS